MQVGTMPWSVWIILWSAMRTDWVVGHKIGRRSVAWPTGSGMGMFMAIGIPVDLPQYELSLSWNFEANYLLPDNLTELHYPPSGPTFTSTRKERDLSRQWFYSLLEERLSSEGFLGRPCLLRSICEAAAWPLTGHNGLLGDLLHLILTPSSTAFEDLPKEYEEAERIGTRGSQECRSSFADCPVDLLELLTTWNQQPADL